MLVLSMSLRFLLDMELLEASIFYVHFVVGDEYFAEQYLVPGHFNLSL